MFIRSDITGTGLIGVDVTMRAMVCIIMATEIAIGAQVLTPAIH